jgi:hypothetical protein
MMSIAAEHMATAGALASFAARRAEEGAFALVAGHVRYLPPLFARSLAGAPQVWKPGEYLLAVGIGASAARTRTGAFYAIFK